MQRKISEWSRTYYLVVPANGFFRIGEDVDGTVDRFSPDCSKVVTALAEAAEKKTPIAIWWSAERVRVALERDVPWCQQCCLDQSIEA